MKSTKDFRSNQDSANNTRKVVKLEPMRKSGKEKHRMYNSAVADNDDSDYDSLKEKDSIFDYFDDEEEDD